MGAEHTTSDPGDADLAKAFQEIARGERAASAMEDQLTALEQKIDTLLASAASSGPPNESQRVEEQDTDGRSDSAISEGRSSPRGDDSNFGQQSV